MHRYVRPRPGRRRRQLTCRRCWDAGNSPTTCIRFL
jgi:hypothetical protein